MVVLVASVFSAGILLSKYSKGFVDLSWLKAWDGPVPNVTCSDQNNCGGEKLGATVVEGCVVETVVDGKHTAKGRLAGCGGGNGGSCPPGTFLSFEGALTQCAGRIRPMKWNEKVTGCCEYRNDPCSYERHGKCVSERYCVSNRYQTGSCVPILTPTPTPTSTPAPSPTELPTPTPTPTVTPSGTPNYCGGTCGSNYNCQGGLFCYQGYCRNPECGDESDCGCPGATPTPTPPPVLGASTPPQLPKTGGGLEVLAGLLGMMGIGVWVFKRFKLV